MARKKIVFVIVEGPSDEEALGIFLNRIYDKNTVYIHIVHGDLTTKPENIRNKIADAVRGYADSTHLKKSDFQEVIHIVDMDGAYVPEEAVIEDISAQEVVYSTTEIRTANREGILARNEQKQHNLDIISALSTVWGGVPYQAYYMSCNLDHVLYDKLNLTDDEKESHSLAFAKQYKNDLAGFVGLICNSDFSVSEDYLSSWSYIKKEKRSLERHTNLGLCFSPYSEAKE